MLLAAEQRHASERAITIELPKHDPRASWVTEAASPPLALTGLKIWAAVGCCGGAVLVELEIDVEVEVEVETDAEVGVVLDVLVVGPLPPDPSASATPTPTTAVSKSAPSPSVHDRGRPRGGPLAAASSVGTSPAITVGASGSAIAAAPVATVRSSPTSVRPTAPAITARPKSPAD